MVVKEINSVKLGQNKHSVVEVQAATSTSHGVALDFTGKCDKTFVLVENTGSSNANFVVKKGDGLQGVKDYASGDIAGKAKVVINLESGRFKQLSGENKGKVVILPSSTDLKFAVVELP